MTVRFFGWDAASSSRPYLSHPFIPEDRTKRNGIFFFKKRARSVRGSTRKVSHKRILVPWVFFLRAADVGGTGAAQKPKVFWSWLAPYTEGLKCWPHKTLGFGGQRMVNPCAIGHVFVVLHIVRP